MAADGRDDKQIHGDLVQGAQYVLSGDFRNAFITIYEGGVEVRRIPLQRPETATHFTGRGVELEELLAALQPGRVVTLYGPGGIGKTALAAEALAGLMAGEDPPPRFPGGILFYSFYGQPSAAAAADHVVRSCGGEPDPADPFGKMAATLRGRAALLVLDGAEEADDLDALLDARGGGGALITSRRRADVRDVGIEVERLPPDDALALLRAWAKQWAAGEEAAEVCELVGNLPLALRLAGRYMFVEGQSAAEYRDWLREAGLAALDFGDRRRDSVPILMDRSLAQVSEAARAALGAAGCLALQPFEVAPVAAALDIKERDARRVMGELHNYELLRRAGAGYETAHALVYAYARDRLPVETTALRRLGDYYATLAEAESARGLPGYQRLNPERTHILAVLGRLAAAGEWAAANRLVWAVKDWLDIQGYPRDRIAALEVGLVAARELGDQYDQAAHSNHLGNTYRDLGQVERAIEFYEAALAIHRETGDRLGEGVDLGNLGSTYNHLGQVERAIEFHEAALAISRETGNRRGEEADLGNMGNAYHNLGQVERAIEFHEAALAIARETGDWRGEGTVLGNLGIAYSNLGQVERAIEFYEAALAIARETGDQALIANQLIKLAMQAFFADEDKRAFKLIEEAITISRRISSASGIVSAMFFRGGFEWAIYEDKRALSTFKEALEISIASGFRPLEAILTSFIGLINGEQGAKVDGLAAIEKASIDWQDMNLNPQFLEIMKQMVYFISSGNYPS